MHGPNSDGGLVVPRASLDGGLSADTGVSATSTIVGNGSPWLQVNRDGNPRTLASRPSASTLVGTPPTDGIEISFPELDGREPAEQLETLKDMLEKATRLKEGAVNFLKMEMTVRVGCALSVLCVVTKLSGYGI